jgi:serine/threonine protein kinase
MSATDHDEPSESAPVYEGDDPRVDKAVHEYMEESDAGRRPSRKEFLARYPEIADELSVCLQGLAFLDAAAAQIKEDAGIRGPQEDPVLTSALASAEPLGDFRLVREIGRGGMGIVYEAFQMSLGRTVALKVLPMAASLDPRQLQRFHNEAQAAAQLHHTNIVPVYAVGCERSVHYYAMQLIEGKSIAEVIRALREKQEKHGSNSTTNSLTELSSLRSSRRPDYYRYVANLAVQAARALDYAHQIGVVHRDIKPANLLFDWRGTLWITDFGLAQIYSEAPHNMTMPGDMLGTMRYMSPEQASGSGAVLDGRTDVYSLGVTLYELLTLERAVGGDSRQEMLRRIAQVDPIPPRAFDKRIPIELETIVMKAIAKEPRDRYSTARAMAEDLERFLRHEPILARRPTTWDQVSKWVHRHWHLTASVLIILTLATIGLSVSTIYISREKTKTKEALEVARIRALDASRAQIQASENFAQARQAVEFMTRIASDEMPDDPRLAPLRRRLLETSLSYYQNFLAQEKRTHANADLTREQAQINELLAKLTSNDQWAEVNYQLWLLAQSSVANELQLNTNQRMSVRGLSDSDDSWDMFNPGDGPPPDMRPPPDQMRRGPQDPKPLQQALRSILTVRQMDRLQQISRQLRGPAAFADVDVASALSLTPTQKSLVQTIRTHLEDRSMGPPGTPGEDRAARTQSATQQILKQLTPDQQHTWNTLIGEPFHGYVESRERRPGPPPPQW